MNIVPWKSRGTSLDLFRDIEEMQRQMNRLFDFSLHRPVPVGDGGPFWTPPVDVADGKDSITVRVDLPGMKKDEIEVMVVNDTCTIKGEKKQEKEIKEKDCIRSERYYGAFHRSFTLPASVDTQKVNASYKDGVLELILPKKEEAKSNQVKIQIK